MRILAYSCLSGCVRVYRCVIEHASGVRVCVGEVWLKHWCWHITRFQCILHSADSTKCNIELFYAWRKRRIHCSQAAWMTMWIGRSFESVCDC